ncbi:MAG: DUF4105 domain-containing protein [Deltaproteobacteria bacterium]|nr:DUF4105 domain-containing protein [Deltaproteobacteria bacterium]
MRVFFILLTGLGLTWLGETAVSADPPAVAALIRQASEANLADSRVWHLLLHYHPRLLGGYKSQIDEPTFFLAPEGKTNPQAELAATLRAFFSPELVGHSEQPAQCAFIARYHWLKTALAIDDDQLPPQSCEQFEEWFAELNPASLTLVFPSAYMHNPASMFGHTLLRIDQQGQTAQTRLLAYAVNFAADITSTNWLTYVLSGVSGGFRGHFFTKPYYVLVKEYGDFENRDIWEYRLQLTGPQIERLLMHVWELKAAFFDYFFFQQNCSYQLLPLLEVANPTLHLTEAFRWWTIPGDTVRLIVQQPHFVSEATYRPAPSTQIRRRRAQMSEQERRALTLLLRDPAFSESPDFRRLLLAQQAAALDLAIDYLEYQRLKIKVPLSAPKRDQLHSLLVTRSARPILTDATPIEPFVTRPDLGHGSLRAGFGVGWREHDWFEELSVRAGYHDLLDPDPGYTPDAQIEVLALSARYYHKQNRVRLERFTLVDMLSLSPIEPFFLAPSWKVRAGFETLRRGCHYGQNFNLNGGLGLAVQTRWPRRTVWFAFPELELNYSHAFNDDYQAGAGGTFGLLVQLGERWKIFASGTYIQHVWGDPSGGFLAFIGQRYTLSQNLAVEFTFRHREHDNQAVFLVQVYH